MLARTKSPEVEIRIDATSGQVSVEVHGMEGASCEEVAGDFAFLGRRRESRRKPEYSRGSAAAGRTERKVQA